MVISIEKKMKKKFGKLEETIVIFGDFEQNQHNLCMDKKEKNIKV